MTTTNVHVRIPNNSGNCEVSVNLSSCDVPTNEVGGRVISHSESQIEVVIDQVQMFYGSSVVAEFKDICDTCSEIYYIPDIMPTGCNISFYRL